LNFLKVESETVLGGLRDISGRELKRNVSLLAISKLGLISKGKETSVVDLVLGKRTGGELGVVAESETSGTASELTGDLTTNSDGAGKVVGVGNPGGGELVGKESSSLEISGIVTNGEVVLGDGLLGGVVRSLGTDGDVLVTSRGGQIKNRSGINTNGGLKVKVGHSVLKANLSGAKVGKGDAGGKLDAGGNLGEGSIDRDLVGGIVGRIDAVLLGGVSGLHGGIDLIKLLNNGGSDSDTGSSLGGNGDLRVELEVSSLATGKKVLGGLANISESSDSHFNY